MTVPFALRKNTFTINANHFEKRELKRDELQKILDVMKPESLEMQKEKIGRIALSPADVDWLRATFLFEFWTTRRREDVIKLTWKQVYQEEENMYIDFINHKNSRRKQNASNPDFWTGKPFPCHSELKKLLIELGFGKKDGDDYIIYSQEEQMRDFNLGLRNRKTLNRTRMIDLVTRGFTFFAKVAGIKNATNKSLKKGGITEMINQIGGDIHFLTDHSNMDVINSHYANTKRIVTEQSKKLIPFSIKKSA